MTLHRPATGGRFLRDAASGALRAEGAANPKEPAPAAAEPAQPEADMPAAGPEPKPAPEPAPEPAPWKSTIRQTRGK